MKKNVLWSLPYRYDNPTPSEAILPPAASQARQAILTIWRKKFMESTLSVRYSDTQRSGLKCQRNHILAKWIKKLYGVYPVRTIIRHSSDAQQSYFGSTKKKVLWSLPCRYNNPTPSEAILPPPSSAGYFDDMKKKVYGVYLVRTIIRHPAKRSEMPRNHILANWRKKVLWSLPCPYDISRHPAKRSYRHQARQAILTIWRKKFMESTLSVR